MTTLLELASVAHSCRRCPLAEGRTNVVFGEGSPTAQLMIVGEGPGQQEDLHGRPFIGRSGGLLDRLLAEEAGLQRAEVYITNVVKCRPPNNRDPKPAEIGECRPYLDQQVALIAPVVILTLGNFASRALLSTSEGIRKLRGQVYPFGDTGAVVVPTFHPAAALRSPHETLPQMRADFVRVKRAIAAAAAR
jgi:uracil-DNA glycosylase family 4